MCSISSNVVDFPSPIMRIDNLNRCRALNMIKVCFKLAGQVACKKKDYDILIKLKVEVY